MPGRDGTGPSGAGAMAGKGMGACKGAGHGVGGQGGRGAGLRHRRGFGRHSAADETVSKTQKELEVNHYAKTKKMAESLLPAGK